MRSGGIGLGHMMDIVPIVSSLCTNKRGVTPLMVQGAKLLMAGARMPFLGDPTLILCMLWYVFFERLYEYNLYFR